MIGGGLRNEIVWSATSSAAKIFCTGINKRVRNRKICIFIARIECIRRLLCRQSGKQVLSTVQCIHVKIPRSGIHCSSGNALGIGRGVSPEFV